MSSNFNFSPILHNITPERVLFCYRQNDEESLDVAHYYQNARKIPSKNLLGLNCTTANVISEEDYVTFIEEPIRDRIDSYNTGESGIDERIWVIILGYHLPHIFLHNNERIAIASRLQRLSFGPNRDYKIPNFTYDRKMFQFFSANDAASVFITAVIDGPTKADALNLIDRSIDVDNQSFITGKCYVDPFGLKKTTEQIKYEEDMTYFVEKELENLGLETDVTVDFNDPYREPMVMSLQHDSFYWGWFTPRFSIDLFSEQNERRAFLYNADNDSASDISADLDLNGSDPWCNLSIKAGYASCAGAVSSPGEEAYLRARPFFESLHQGASLGESFLFASPYLDWKIILIGDPLMVINFPSGLPKNQDSKFIGSITTDDPVLFFNNEAIIRIKESIENSLAYGHKQSSLIKKLTDITLSSGRLDESVALLPSAGDWQNSNTKITHANSLSNAIQFVFNHILKTQNITFKQWLVNNNQKVTSILNELLVSISQPSLLSELIYPSGHWQFDMVYIHTLQTLENIHFRLQVARDSSFADIVLDLKSDEDITGWYYEKEPYEFSPMMQDGLPSNFSGRRVRFVSPPDSYLHTLEIYFVRWFAINESQSVLFSDDAKNMIVSR